MATTAAQPQAKRPRKQQTPIIDCDVHNAPLAIDVAPFLSKRWRTYLDTFGQRTRGEAAGLIRARWGASRSDTWPENGTPGSVEPFAREQLLDAYGIDFAVLNNNCGNEAIYVGGNQPREYSADLIRAVNDWTDHQWLKGDPRWYSAVSVPFEDGAAAAREIARCRDASDRWIQVLVSDRTRSPFGHEKYWPIIEAAVAYDIPIAFHPGGIGGNLVTASGWPSYYFEDHVGYPQAVFAQLASLVCEGVFDRWPTLKIVIVEGGWSWVAPFSWRFDASWSLLREEVPHLQRKPSEYMRDHLWFTSQPIEEPENPKWFNDVYAQFERAGFAERLMFSSDYPHWDFDSPATAVPQSLTPEQRERILFRNALGLYPIPLA